VATFSQWHKIRRLAPVTWVCGPEPVLAREVEAEFRAHHEPGETWALWAGENEAGDVWDELLTEPGLSRRLTIVHEAEKLGQLERMDQLTQGSPDGASVVFISAAGDFDRAEEDGKKVLAPHLETLKACKDGQMIRCCAPSKPEDRAALVASWWPGASLALGRQVLDRCGENLTWARETCAKATAAGLGADEKYLTTVCEPELGTQFAELLIARDKAGALKAVSQASPGEIALGLGLLASRLRALGALSEAKRRGARSSTDLAIKTHLDRWLISKLAAFAQPYDIARVRRCRELLALADSHRRQGAQTGVAEMVIALW
jgi:hypothetical protein